MKFSEKRVLSSAVEFASTLPLAHKVGQILTTENIRKNVNYMAHLGCSLVVSRETHTNILSGGVNFLFDFISRVGAFFIVPCREE